MHAASGGSLLAGTLGQMQDSGLTAGGRAIVGFAALQRAAASVGRRRLVHVAFAC